MILTDGQLDEIRERNASRSPGQWTLIINDIYYDCTVGSTTGDEEVLGEDAIGWSICGLSHKDDQETHHPEEEPRSPQQRINDGHFIAHSPTDITNLLETVDALKARVEFFENQVRIIGELRDRAAKDAPNGSYYSGTLYAYEKVLHLLKEAE